ncbi:MAG TPA: hypothetical protein VEZ14_01115 [Dehalococcoidia bacterium]|nr:hypothetical protein [Dehalococcoidia bacterium]
MKTEWLILADHVDVVGNKLYLNGGGWSVLTVNSGFPVQQNLGVAAAFSVPWNETNHRANVEIDVLTADGVTLAKAAGQLEVGRPPGLPAGQPQRAQIAVNMTLSLDKPGTYEIITRIEGQEDKRTHFNVVPGPMLLMKPPQEGAA